MSNALRVGVVGHGNIATIAQLPTLVTRDDVETAALVSISPDPEPVKRRWGFQNAYPTLEAALDAQELDAVFVLPPPAPSTSPWPRPRWARAGPGGCCRLNGLAELETG
ncbi:hypothetical protein [Actinomyces sp.]|uniref:hypothetical protein n=1 Tax=Actinomyces sp. TaxID=29317 RepID=UPI0026DAB298|nr:hypothetical protein [Actinomyces sp.]MDO4901068.1 hypothetical protein [Actinomyces sp.]